MHRLFLISSLGGPTQFYLCLVEDIAESQIKSLVSYHLLHIGMFVIKGQCKWDQEVNPIEIFI